MSDCKCSKGYAGYPGRGRPCEGENFVNTHHFLSHYFQYIKVIRNSEMLRIFFFSVFFFIFLPSRRLLTNRFIIAA